MIYSNISLLGNLSEQSLHRNLAYKHIVQLPSRTSYKMVFFIFVMSVLPSIVYSIN